MESIDKGTERVAIDLITGFLGAGKTTFIRGYVNWLQSKGIRTVIVENEFGAAGVDTVLLEAGNCHVKELTGGCICCSMKANFHDSLVELSEKYGRIVVEPSGVFNLGDYFDVMNSPDVQACCRIGSIVTVVDPTAMETMSVQDWEVLSTQLRGTGGVLFSHMDAVEEIYNAVILCKAFVNPQIKDWYWAKPWNDFNEQDYSKIAELCPLKFSGMRTSIDHNTIFNSTTIYPEAQYSKHQIMSAIEGIFSQECGTILRLKGYVRRHKTGYWLLNCTPNNRLVEIRYKKIQPMLNIIGRNLKRKIIKEKL